MNSGRRASSRGWSDADPGVHRTCPTATKRFIAVAEELVPRALRGEGPPEDVVADALISIIQDVHESSIMGLPDWVYPKLASTTYAAMMAAAGVVHREVGGIRK